MKVVIVESVRFPRIFVCIGAMIAFLAACSDCRPASEPGTVTNTRAANFRWFFDRIANPCDASTSSLGNTLASTSTTTTTSTSTASSVSQNVPSIDFYHSMELALTATLGKLHSLETADPSLPECNGISLDSLPATPLLDNFNDGETIKQTYKAIIFLTTHFHLMSSDRQLPATGNNVPVITEGSLESDSRLPLWRFQRCGNETERFPSLLVDVTTALENILCTILSSATAEQTQSFREPLNSLQETVLYRYHTSCSTLQTRDCLVVREAKQSLNLISRKYKQLIQQSNSNNAEGNGLNSSSNNNFDDMDNNI